MQAVVAGDLVDRIEMVTLRADCQKGGVDHATHRRHVVQRPGGPVQAIDVDTFRLAVDEGLAPGVGSNVDNDWFQRSLHRLDRRRDDEGKDHHGDD